MTNRARRGSHSVYSIRLHFVFVTKYRREVITVRMLKRIEEIFSNICEKTGCVLMSFSGEADHVHLLVDFHPDNKVSALVNSLKSASSRILRKEFAEYLENIYWKPVLWSGSYYVASTGGAAIEKLKEYIKSQDSPTT